MQWQIVWVRKNNNNYEVSIVSICWDSQNAFSDDFIHEKKINKFLNFLGEVQKKKNIMQKKKSLSINISYLKFKSRYTFLLV